MTAKQHRLCVSQKQLATHHMIPPGFEGSKLGARKKNRGTMAIAHQPSLETVSVHWWCDIR